MPAYKVDFRARPSVEFGAVIEATNFEISSGEGTTYVFHLDAAADDLDDAAFQSFLSDCEVAAANRTALPLPTVERSPEPGTGSGSRKGSRSKSGSK